MKKSRKIENQPREVRQVAVTTPNLFLGIGRSWLGSQNELYTSLVRPFLRKLCCCEVGPFLTDFPEIPFWSICECEMPATKNLGF